MILVTLINHVYRIRQWLKNWIHLKKIPCSTSYISEFFDLGYCHSDLELMKERFSKLLLGEDMSGHGKGVSLALTLSNAITNLAGFFFQSLPFCPPNKYKIFVDG